MPAQFIAEVSSNHHASLERCLQFIGTAAKIGCDGVKFQLFRIDQLFAPEILARSAKHRERKQWELPPQFIPDIGQACKQNSIDFICTPFDLPAVDTLYPYVDAYKIASYELTWPALLKECAATQKPVILSTGMATLSECKAAVHILSEAGCDKLTVLHCVSLYPTPPECANLAAIHTLRDSCDCAAGWSDHTVLPGVIYQAVFGFGAEIIEFHLDLEGKGAEFSAGHCWLPDQIGDVIKNIRLGESSVGNGVKINVPQEERERLWRADPKDGYRPFKEMRLKFKGDGV
ncbi:MAG: N-acetylneuraminate synthase family protein [Deltaproteobacteria bacterium]|nr:N-acetylneuraminate synthase family protein [Deltaproteobacteria bacterium]